MRPCLLAALARRLSPSPSPVEVAAPPASPLTSETGAFSSRAPPLAIQVIFDRAGNFLLLARLPPPVWPPLYRPILIGTVGIV